MLRMLVVLALLSLLAACAPAPLTPTPTIPPFPSPWSAPVTLGHAQQSDPPVIWPAFGGVFAAWVGADAAGVHENAVHWSSGTLGSVTVLPLPPRHPYALRGLPATDGDLHLLWLDADPSGSTHLFSAVLSNQLSVARGPTVVSDRTALRYDAAAGDNGSLWTVWSGDLPAEPSVFAQQIDADGRPRAAVRVATDATEPALARANDGTTAVYWLGASDGQIYRAALTSSGVGPTAALTASIRLEATDQLDALRAGQDSTHAYLFWNVTRGDGTHEVWMASGPLNAIEWSQPRKLSMTANDGTLKTTWGAVASATASGEPVRRVGPTAGQHDLLPVAAEINGALDVLYFQGGKLVGAEKAADTSGLLAAPSLTSGSDGGLILAWAEPGDDGTAALNLALKQPVVP